jgi:hypothetical protein
MNKRRHDTIDYVRYSHLGIYLFKAVRSRFQRQHSIGAFDLFSIVIWKANRAKSRIALRLLERQKLLGQKPGLEWAARKLSGDLWRAQSSRDRLLILMRDWGFRLPMASAILTVLWPDEFTVYDDRVCGQLRQLGGPRCNYSWLKNRDPEHVWDGYCDYRNAVQRLTPRRLSLREKDGYLWGRSAAQQLERDLRSCFGETHA